MITERLMLSCIMDALEGPEVASSNIPGGFLHADIEDIVNMRIYEAIEELLMRVDPSQYKKHVVTDKGKKVLYISPKKTLYGTLKA